MEIELTAQAEADLVEIGDFIAKDNPSAAERYVKRLRDRIAVLREFPEAGHRIRKRSNVRALVERPIIIVYTVKGDRIVNGRIPASINILSSSRLPASRPRQTTYV